VFSPRVCTSP